MGWNYRKSMPKVEFIYQFLVHTLICTSEDIVAYTIGNWTASALSKVNGQEVGIFLEDLAQLGFQQDPDALYNTLMFEMAFDAQSPQTRYTGTFAHAGRFGYYYPGANTTIEFENGTISTYQNYAEIITDFTGVVDGPSFYLKFCKGPNEFPFTERKKASKAPTPPPASGSAHGYPTPFAITEYQQLSGYFPVGPEFSDVAVLSILSFEPTFLD